MSSRWRFVLLPHLFFLPLPPSSSCCLPILLPASISDSELITRWSSVIMISACGSVEVFMHTLLRIWSTGTAYRQQKPPRRCGVPSGRARELRDLTRRKKEEGRAQQQQQQLAGRSGTFESLKEMRNGGDESRFRNAAWLDLNGVLLLLLLGISFPFRCVAGGWHARIPVDPTPYWQ